MRRSELQQESASELEVRLRGASGSSHSPLLGNTAVRGKFRPAPSSGWDAGRMRQPELSVIVE